MIKNNEYELKRINGRTKILVAMVVLLLMVIVMRVYYLQHVEHEGHQQRAYKNATRTIEVAPKRGDIYDRSGRLIAGNRGWYDLVVVPEQIHGYKRDKEIAIADFLKTLSDIVPLEKPKLKKIGKAIRNSYAHNEVIVSSDLPEASLTAFTVNQRYIDGLYIKAKFVRDYPDNDLFLSYLGYVGRVAKSDLASGRDYLLKDSFVGKSGLERVHDLFLHGQRGLEKAVLNASGRVVDRIRINAPRHGEDLHTTIDYELQKIAYDTFSVAGKKGAAVAMDLSSGDLLTFFSNPTFDANYFVKGIPQSVYDKHFSVDSPLFNRVVQGQYSPASTVKPFVALGALEGDFIDAGEIVTCGGYYRIGKQKFRDWKRQGHGKIDMIQAVARSSDVYFYKLADKMGISYLHDFLKLFGYGERPDVDFTSVKSGLLPSDEWKRRVHNEPFYTGDTVIVSVGQGAFLATPLQMLTSVSILANDGDRVKPRFLQSSPVVRDHPVNFTVENLAVAKAAMKEVVHGKRGTARSHNRGLNFEMAGKTGTSQVFSTRGEIDYENEDMPEHLRDHGLFISFAPFDDPKIAVAVVIEHGESGARLAAELAVKLTTAYLKRFEVQEVESVEKVDD
jgi:penicillin-binding protein 2